MSRPAAEATALGSYGEQSRNPLRIISIYEIVGGIYTLVWLPFMLANTAVLGLIGLAVSAALSVYAGVGLFRHRRRGYELSKLIQLFQIPIVMVPNFAYRLTVGAHLAGTVALDADATLSFQAQFGSHFIFAFGSHAYPLALGVNALALICWFVLLRSEAPDPGTPIGIEPQAA